MARMWIRSVAALGVSIAIAAVSAPATAIVTPSSVVDTAIDVVCAKLIAGDEILKNLFEDSTDGNYPGSPALRDVMRWLCFPGGFLYDALMGPTAPLDDTFWLADAKTVCVLQTVHNLLQEGPGAADGLARCV